MAEADRFWAKVRKTSGCWVWTARTSGGYGMFRLSQSRKIVRAHRYAYEEAHGQPIPDGLFALHRCDNPACVNPDHIFLGTIADNVADMFAKGRQPSRKGEKNGQAKLTAREVVAIRNDTDSTHKALASKYGVARSMVSMIKAGRYWNEVNNG